MENRCCGCLTMACSKAPHSCLLRLIRIKGGKLLVWDKDNLIVEAKAIPKWNKELIPYFPSLTSRCSAFPRRAGLSCVTEAWENRFCMSSLTSFFPQVCILSMTSHGLEYCFGQLGPPISSVSPANFSCTLSLLLVEWCEEQRNLGSV